MKRLDEVEVQAELEDFMYLESLYNDEEEDLLDEESYLLDELNYEFDSDDYEDDEEDL